MWNQNDDNNQGTAKFNKSLYEIKYVIKDLLNAYEDQMCTRNLWNICQFEGNFAAPGSSFYNYVYTTIYNREAKGNQSKSNFWFELHHPHFVHKQSTMYV